MVSLGISEQDADAEIDRELDVDFLEKGQRYHTVYADLLTWSFGVA